jgi:predicted MFS family arabinose efflux permease
LILGPLFNNWFGVRGIFWMTAVLALGGLAVLFVLVPTPLSVVSARHRQPAPKQLLEVLRDGHLRRLDFGIFMLHLMLTAMFVVVPVALVQEAGIPAGDHWKFYLSVIGLSVLGMVPLVALSARKHLVRRVFAAAVALIGVGQAVLAMGHAHLVWLAFGLWVFFVGFNVLEAMLPSLVSRIAPAHSKGGAVGVYNSAEFFGAFLGGAAGGLVYGAYGVEGVFAGCVLLALIWLAVAVSGPAPRLLDTHLIDVGARGPDEARDLARRLSDIPGVAEAVVVAEEGVAYLKVDSRIFDRDAVEQITTGAA